MFARVQLIALVAKLQNFLRTIFVSIHAEMDTMNNQIFAPYVLLGALNVHQPLVAANVLLFIILSQINV